nr:putative mitochondrial protein [Tanacetum cinerariifolium]
MAAKKVESMEADLEKYLEEVKGKFVALGNKLDSKVKALKKRQELEDKQYEEVKNMLLSLTNKDTSYARPVEPLKKVQIGLKIDDLGFPIPPTNTRTSADGGQKKISKIMGKDDNNWGDYDRFGGSNRINLVMDDGIVKEKNRVRNTIRTSSGTRANHIEGRFFNHGYDHRMRKIKMPLFDGEDAHGWIYKAERYFESKARAPFRSWEELKRRFLDRFQPSQEGNLHEQFLSITQDGSAKEYVSLFEQIAGQLRGVSGGYGRNLYQRCDEKFRHGHRCPRKTLQVLLVGDEYKTEHEFDEKSDDHMHLDMVEVSLNFVMGFTSPHTMKIQGIIGDEEVVVLIDSGATHNFLSKRVLKELGLLVMGGGSISVMLGNKKFEKSRGICKGVLITFPELQILKDFYPLDLGSTHVILGIKWLQTLGDTLVNWKKLMMSFEIDNKKVMIKGDPGLCRSLVSYKALLRSLQKEKGGFLVEMKSLEESSELLTKQMEEHNQILAKFKDVFHLPRGLPPHRDHEHAIVLKEGTTPISVRPYRYLYAQKNKIEKLVKEMLKVRVIQLSSSMFSVLLVKKKMAAGDFALTIEPYITQREVAESVLPEGLAEDMEVILQPEEVLGIREGSNSTQGSRKALICLKNLPGYEATW